MAEHLLSSQSGLYQQPQMKVKVGVKAKGQADDKESVRRVTVGFSKAGWTSLVLVLTLLTTISIASHQHLVAANQALGVQQEKLYRLQVKQEELKEDRALLTRYDRISRIAKEHGMTLNEEQVRAIADEK